VTSRLLPALYRGGALFWNLTVNKMTAAVLRTLQGMDAEGFASTAEEVAGARLPSKRALPTSQGQHIYFCFCLPISTFVYSCVD
jgi:hypothetical protein